MRTKLIIELVKEVIGPRKGINETIEENPLTEYITGVLAPMAIRNPQLIEDEQEIPSDSSESYDEEESDVDIQTPVALSPALDPKSRPSSMGLSFILKAKKNAKLKVCITWAKYKVLENSKEKETNRKDTQVWQRFPNHSISDIDLKSSTKFIDSTGKETFKENAELSLDTTVNWDGDKCAVDLFLVNVMVPTPNFQDIQKHIFQPQIRVVFEGDAFLIEGLKSTPIRPEEQQLAFLYRKRPVFGRGHLCSVVWRDIDPENREGLNPKYSSSIDKVPLFNWIDGLEVPEADRNIFSKSQIRTEFIPMYPVPFPKLNWPEEFGKPPELCAEVY